LLRDYDAPIVITLLDFWWVCANAQLLTNDTEDICDGPNLYLNCGRCAAARAGLPAVMGTPSAPIFALRNRWLRPILAHADAVFAPTQFTADWYSQRVEFDHPVQIIPLGFEPSETASLLRVSTSSRQKLKLAYVGGLSQQKGVHVIIDAINQLKDVELTLTIGGDESKFPDYVTQLKLAADDRVNFMGKLTPAEVRQLMADSDLLLVSSVWYETYAIVVSEAFAAGIPVIVSDLGALAERVDEGVNGFKAKAGDVTAWANAIEKAANNRPLLDKMAQNRPKPFTMADHYAAVMSLYEDAKNRHQRR
ncbi:MAG: glycosyltransferase, partial [Chloroflexota bacterium]